MRKPGKLGENQGTDLSRLPARVLLPGGERPAPTEAGAETGAEERHWRSLTPRHALRRAQPCLVAKSYRTLTKKSGTAEAIPDFFGRGRRTWSPLRSGRLVACVPPARTRPSARGFGVDVGERGRERGRASVTRFSRTSPKRVVLVWCSHQILQPFDFHLGLG